MKGALVFVFALPFLAVGCVATRLVEVKTIRVQVGASNSNGLTDALAVDLFNDVATQLGLVVKGPIRVSGVETEFSAQAQGNGPANKSWLIIAIDDKQVRFVSSVLGSKEDFADAQRAAAIFEKALDDRGIRYEVHFRHSAFWAP